MKYKRAHHGRKYVFLNNGAKITNIVFTDLNHKSPYMMISWVSSYTNYNWLYLNASTASNKMYNTATLEIITKTQSEYFNLIGLHYGAAAAIFFSKLLPTRAVISIDYTNILNYCNWDLKFVLENNKAIFFFHSFDIDNHNMCFDVLKQTGVIYLTQKSGIPDAERIIQYIEFAAKIKDNRITNDGPFLP